MRLSLLSICCIAALPAASLANTPASSVWRDAARASMTPAYDWAVDPAAVAEAPNARLSLREATHEAMVSSIRGTELALTFSEGSLGRSLTTTPPDRLLAFGRSAFSASQTNTSLRHSFDDQSQVALTAIIARNRFSTPGMGSSPWHAPEQFTGVRQQGVAELSEGGGVQLSFDRALSDALTLNLAMRSRLDMDPFKSYRGIYSEAGDFDLPGFAQMGVEWSLGSRYALGFDVQRVLYSDVQPFTSTVLPSRFLALLGDGGSPEFAWRDLTVYSAEFALLDDVGGRWSLRYSTQQQPEPTSAILSRALADQYSDTNLSMGYQRNFGVSSTFQLAASYAPAAYFTAPAPFVQRDFDGGSQVEIEAQWTLAF